MEKNNPPPYSVHPPPPGMPCPPQDYSYTAQPPPPGINVGYPSYPPTGQYVDPQNVTNVTATRVIITSGGVWGPNPQPTICPSCHAEILTNVVTEPNTKTHLFALLLCIFQCYLCCCIPYCVDSCQSQNHFCPNCRAFLGSYAN